MLVPEGNAPAHGAERHLPLMVVGVCDPKAHDHQWKVPLGTVSGSVALRDKHRPAETSDVCATFK